MSATYIGQMTVGAAMPAAGAAASAGVDGIGAAMPDLDQRIAALTASLANLATLPSLPSYEDIKLRAVANLGAISASLLVPGLPPPPSLDAALIALAALLEALQIIALDLDAKVSALLSFQQLLAAANVHVAVYDGAIGSLGADVQSVIPIATGHVNAIALVTTNGVTWGAMSSVFKVTP